jgi:hypothetical protein
MGRSYHLIATASKDKAVHVNNNNNNNNNNN